MEQQIRFCTTSDGVRIAYAIVGEGPPFVVTPGSWESITLRLAQEEATRFYEPLAERHTLVFYDRRGVGLSDRERADFTIEADIRDLEAVADSLGEASIVLMGSFHLGPAAIVYAARHPERVSRLILYGTYARGRELTRDDIKASIISLARSHWGMAARTLADFTAPNVGPQMLERIVRNQRESTTGEMVASLLELAYAIDVMDVLPQVQAPTLVLHRQNNQVVPFRLGRELSSLLPNARLVSLDGVVYWPWFGDADSILDAIFEFLGEERPARRPSVEVGLAPVTILFTDIQSSTALTQRLGDAKAQELRRAHNAIVRSALKTHGGAEIKHTGDGIMASFPSASRALECAVEIQRGAEHNRREGSGHDAPPATLGPLHVHIGLNAGEPIAEEADLFGTAVDLARRICDQAEGGEILASNVVRELAAGKGFLFADRGQAALKGFEDPVRLYEVRWRD